jgi:hypothetical protein
MIQMTIDVPTTDPDFLKVQLELHSHIGTMVGAILRKQPDIAMRSAQEPTSDHVASLRSVALSARAKARQARAQ